MCVDKRFTPTENVAWFIAECPDVRFFDLGMFRVPSRKTVITVDPLVVECCERGTIQVAGHAFNFPAFAGFKVLHRPDEHDVGVRVEIPWLIWALFGAFRKDRGVSLHVSGIRRGFLGVRHSWRNHEQRKANDETIDSAYPAVDFSELEKSWRQEMAAQNQAAR